MQVKWSIPLLKVDACSSTLELQTVVLRLCRSCCRLPC